MRISFNASAVIANNSLTKNDNKLSESLARLSSGLKIVNAKDNPSGLAMSKRMNAQIEGLSVATNNASDGVSIIEIADGTMAEIHDMLQRINELSVKSSTGTLTDEDRKLIDDEAQQLKDEIERIANEAEFNGQKILDGSFDLKGYTSEADIKVAYYSDDVKVGKYEISELEVKFDAEGNLDTDNSKITLSGPSGSNAKITQVDGSIVTITGDQGFELKLKMKDITAKVPINTTDASGNPVTKTLSLDLTGFGAMDMQIGANEGQQLGIRIPRINAENMGIDSLDLTTAEGAQKAIDQVDNAIKYISNARSGLGAYQNRLEHTISSLDISSENMTAAYSRIMDVDMAEEMTEYTTLQILSQASTSMLAQANERPSQVLQLLQ
ncbi:MAG: flagellin [Suilimivivens sp.]